MKNKTDIMDRLAKNPKFVLRIQNAFNSFCGTCKRLAYMKPGRPMSDYCAACQKKVNDAFGDEIEL